MASRGFFVTVKIVYLYLGGAAVVGESPGLFFANWPIAIQNGVRRNLQLSSGELMCACITKSSYSMRIRIRIVLYSMMKCNVVKPR